MRGGSRGNRRTRWTPALCFLLVVAAAGAGFAGDSSFELDLGGLRFDPLTAFPDLPSRGRHAEDSGPNFRLVQFEGPIRGEWLEAVRARGVHLVQYIHPYTYVVWADRARLDGLRGADGVRWTGELAVEFRVLPRQRGRDATVLPTAALVSRHVDEAALRRDLELAGARIHDLTPVTSQLSVVYLEVPGNRYLELGAIPAVYTVQYVPPEAGPRGEMSNQSIVGNHGPPPGHTLIPGYFDWLDATGYDGSGVIVGIVDGGIRTSHQDLTGRAVPCVPSGDSPTSCTTLNDFHGTHVAGAVAGTGASGILDPAGFLRGQGVAPGASLVQQRYDPFIGGGPGNMQPNGMLKIYRESALSGALLTNNSWGPTGTPQGYDIPTQQVDIITRDADPNIDGHQPVLPVWSIMNGGGDGSGACAPSSLGSPDEAKNLFAVGSTKMQPAVGQQHPDIFDVSFNSAHGPACDGRLVPHVVAPGCETDSASSNSDTAHGLLCGTSMASPVVSGAVAIFVERYRDLHGADPSPALIKAAFTAAAKDLNGFQNADGGTMGHPPDRFQGWGRIDLDAVANPPDNVMFFDQEVVLTESGQSWTVPVAAADPSKPMRLMLVWTDVPGHGLGGTTPAWVNDLDLTVEAKSGLYLGNQIGPDGYSQIGGSADGMNNTEGVFLRPDQHGGEPLEVTVLAANLAGDALDPYDPDSPDLAQDFALACYNCDLSAALPVLQLDPASLDFGDVEVGTTSAPQVATLHNDGSALATGLAFAGLPDAGFVADTSDCGTSLAPGASCEVSVTFTPEGVGAATATLEADSAEGSTASLALEGEGLPAAVVATPIDLEVDPEASGVSNGNGILEPAELVTVAPAWRNDGVGATELAGAATTFSGPPGANYSLVDAAAGYGLLAPGATASCLDTGDCYQMGLNDPATRPAAHWDATFEETLAGGPTRTWTLHIGDSFSDVPRSSPFYPSIETLLHRQVTGGCGPGAYCPAAPNTRSQMPVFLLKALEGGSYSPPACSGVFDDVPCPSLFANWIEDLVARGVTAGCGGGNYCPSNPVSRDQMAVFLLKTLEGPSYAPPACTGVFGDVPCPSLFANWVEDLVARGITAGCGSGNYCPGNPVSRDQMAVFLSKTFGLALYGP